MLCLICCFFRHVANSCHWLASITPLAFKPFFNNIFTSECFKASASRSYTNVPAHSLIASPSPFLISQVCFIGSRGNDFLFRLGNRCFFRQFLIHSLLCQRFHPGNKFGQLLQLLHVVLRVVIGNTVGIIECNQPVLNIAIVALSTFNAEYLEYSGVPDIYSWNLPIRAAPANKSAAVRGTTTVLFAIQATSATTISLVVFFLSIALTSFLVSITVAGSSMPTFSSGVAGWVGKSTLYWYGLLCASTLLHYPVLYEVSIISSQFLVVSRFFTTQHHIIYETVNSVLLFFIEAVEPFFLNIFGAPLVFK